MPKELYPVVLGSHRHLFYKSPDWGLPGQIIQSGIGVPLRQNDWWNVKEMISLPYYGLVFILDGCRGFYRDENNFECQLEYGNFLLIPPDLKRIYGAGKGENWSELSIAFKGSIFDLHREFDLLFQHPPVWKLPKPAIWEKRLLALLEAPRPTNKVGIARETAELLAIILGMMETSTTVGKNESPSDWFSRACLALTQDLSRQPDFRQIAEDLGMSYNTFRHYFTKRAGISPSHFRDQKRLEVACSFLENTDKAHQEIAFYLGYSSPQHFSKHFRSKMKTTPRDFRNRSRQ